MYAKIFEQVFDSSIVEHPEVRFTFMDLLVLSDSNGIVDMTHEAIARRTNRPLDTIKATIAELEKPDDRSRSSEENGARLRRLDEHRDWGWQIVNYQKYREMQNEFDRKEYMRSYMKDYRRKPKKFTKANRRLRVKLPPSASASASVQGESVREGANGGPKPTWEMCLDWLRNARSNGADYTESETRGAYLALSAGGWMWGNRPVADYRSALERQIQTDRQKRPITNGAQIATESLAVRQAKQTLKQTEVDLKRMGLWKPNM